MSMITVIGRGHSGTRAISHTLYASGVYMGSMLNASGDLLPPQAMYDACRVMAKYVEWKGGLEWDFSRLHTVDIPKEFTDLLYMFLQSVLSSDAKHKGWKIPETTLVFPWIARLYPEIRYIYWVRNPRDCILDSHKTDDLREFGIEYPPTDDVRLRRAISWKYQFDIMQATPRPKYWIEVRFEDFVLKQEETLARLEDFLEIPLGRVIMRRDSLERWKKDTGVNYYDFFEPAMRYHGYEIPEVQS
ncbi:MAG TPA: sulfotransferase [Phototrophicaceae bacterium]|nr:sulfotransferase [Phototrophicaceae bacterium]